MRLTRVRVGSMLKRMLRKWTTGSFRASLGAVMLEAKTMRLHRTGTRRARSLKPPLKLHVGSGPNAKPGWVNIDLNEGSDISLDLREPLPFPDGSATTIYSEHFFEHLSLEEGKRFLGESLRVLAPGSAISIGVPDAEKSLQQYVSGDRKRWLEIRKRWHPEWCTTPMHSVNYFFRQDRQHGEHKYAYDFETLAGVLMDCGFVNVRRRDWDPALDLEYRRDGTLYVDAEKPR
jgi:predicted SAM-dependent methyltransferase